ncbi:unnamed protein product [Linum trigynum]|uniref:Reverse transcriptase zinc-binding domain-containing protein n=1 Tax=Linum trigynum TaxID=586398 RepID=A0AAV2EVB9_9ROSI
MDTETRTWNHALLQTHFLPQDKQNILRIPILRQPAEDKRIWGRDKSGLYSVKSTYKALRASKEAEMGEIYTPINWERIWKLQIPPKVKVFAWRWIRNIIPTGANILKRTTKGCDECPFCGQEETQNHLFQDCSWVRRVWCPSSLKLCFQKGKDLTCEEWMVALQETETESDEQIVLFLAALWFIWGERNSQCWNKKKLEEFKIMGKAERWLDEYLEYQQKGSETAPRHVARWKPPDIAAFKINVDAATFAGAGTGLGIVVRDRNEGFCCAAVRRTRIQWPAELAELQAIKFGLEIAMEKGFVPGEMDSDCLRAVQQIEKEEMSMLEEGVGSAEVREMIDNFDGSMEIRFEGRESNKAAHTMAHIQRGWDETELWASRPPIFLVDQLILDSCNISH